MVLAGNVPHILVIHPSLPAKNVKEVVALGRARPGELAFASQGQGTLSHLEQEMLKQMGGFTALHVPYKGSAPAITDTIGGQVELLFAGISSLVPHIKSGRLRALAIGSSARLPMIPEVATFIEIGYPEMTTSVWFGFMAPAATPRAIVAKLNADLDAVLTRRDVREQLIADGQEPGGGTGEEFDAFLKSEIAKYAKVIKLAGIRKE